MPLNDQDLKKVSKLQTGNLMEFWDKVLEPNMLVKKDLEDSEKRLLKDLELRMRKDNQDTRDFIAKKIAEFGGGSVSRDRKLAQRDETLSGKPRDRSVFNDEDVRDIKNMRVFEPREA